MNLQLEGEKKQLKTMNSRDFPAVITIVAMYSTSNFLAYTCILNTCQNCKHSNKK
uniref:Uncharacterized protein n=1 Tax=Octopus bimaculoides TaxID=37653 RepID=A0A0L8GBD7_OCTBM